MNKRTFLLPSAVLFLVVGAAFSQERYVKPVDEAAQDRSFLAFRTRLIAAAERKDAKFIYSILDRNIKVSFGGGEDGIAEFKARWKPKEKNSEFWPEFLRVIRNGGSFHVASRPAKLFTAPYLFTSFPDDLDSFEFYAIVGEDVNLRKEPRTKAAIVARLSYNIVRVEPETVPKSGRSEYPGWYRVRTLGGLSGFVKKQYARSPIDYRAGFEKKRGKWKMVFFLAGD